MQAKIGCPYLSDLPYYKRAVWFEMKCLCLVRGKVILQSQGKEFFTWHGKDFFT